MKWLKNLFSKMKVSPQADDICWLFIECGKCGEKFKVCVHKKTDLMPGYGEDEPPYRLRKEAMDSKCFSPISVRINYDADQEETSREITGGRFLTKEEFNGKGLS